MIGQVVCVLFIAVLAVYVDGGSLRSALNQERVKRAPVTTPTYNYTTNGSSNNYTGSYDNYNGSSNNNTGSSNNYTGSSNNYTDSYNNYITGSYNNYTDSYNNYTTASYNNYTDSYNNYTRAYNNYTGSSNNYTDSYNNYTGSYNHNYTTTAGGSYNNYNGSYNNYTTSIDNNATRNYPTTMRDHSARMTTHRSNSGSDVNGIIGDIKDIEIEATEAKDAVIQTLKIIHELKMRLQRHFDEAW